jgi:BTB/POZ domain-containing protein KCTD9
MSRFWHRQKAPHSKRGRSVFLAFSYRVQKTFRYIQKIITWLTITGTVLGLSFLTIWFHDDLKIHSLWDLFTRPVLRVVFENAESIAIVSAVILYFKEAPDRKEQKHYEAAQVIDNAAAANVPTSYARFKALQDLNEDGVSLRGLDVPGADLEKINLPDADLSRADLSRTDLSDAILFGADLSDAKLFGAKLSRADLSGAILSNAILSNANFSGAKLIDADLSNAILFESKLSLAKLIDADLNRADLFSSDLSGANLSGADLSRANLSNANLSGADLNNANLSGADLSNANLSGTDLSNANLSGTDLSNANLQYQWNVFGGLSPEQVKCSNNWETAKYDKKLRQKLGLPPDDENSTLI